MKTTLLVTIATLSIASTPALAGKKKGGKGKRKPVAAEKQESRRLCDTLGLGIALAPKTGVTAPVAQLDDSQAVAAATSFDLDRLQGRKADAPTGEAMIRMEAQTLTAAQAGQVIRGQGDDLEYCWNRVPEAQRGASSFTLKLTISTRGAVESMALGGDAPEALSTCLAETSAHWVFPIADAQSEIEYPISFN